MSTESAKAFEEKLLTIDLVDGLRREQERLDIALDDRERMQELRSEIRAYYEQAGIAVSDALIDRAIAERQQQRFAFRPPKLGTAGHIVARAWIYRGRVGAIAGTIALVATGGWLVDRQLADRAQAQQAETERAHASAIACLADSAADAAPADAAILNALQDEGEALPAAGADDWNREANATCAFFAAPVRLRVVSETGEQSGVWRYFDGDRGARAYYLVVDALSASGAPVAVPFESAEDGREYRQSRFAVRVDEALYERVRTDKLDDGVLQEQDAGAKPANSLQWDLPAGFEPSFIAEW